MNKNDIKDIVSVIRDRRNGTLVNYTAEQADKLVREALVEANGGLTYLATGTRPEFYQIVQEIVDSAIQEGLQGDEYFNELVEYKTVGFGDKEEFVVEGNSLFVVADASAGNQGIRRQRLNGEKTVAIPTHWQVVKVYEELERILSGKADFNKIMAKVDKSFKAKLYEDIFSAFAGLTADDLGGSVYVQSGSYTTDGMIDLVNHVEAATGASAIITTTKKGARQLVTSGEGVAVAADARNDLYQNGYFGKFFGTPIVIVPQRHRVGTTNFLFDDDVINVIASNGKPIKSVIEGTPIVNLDNPMSNPDMVQNYFFGQKTGCGVAVAEGGVGRYEIV